MYSVLYMHGWHSRSQRKWALRSNSGFKCVLSSAQVLPVVHFNHFNCIYKLKLHIELQNIYLRLLLHYMMLVHRHDGPLNCKAWYTPLIQPDTLELKMKVTGKKEGLMATEKNHSALCP